MKKALALFLFFAISAQAQNAQSIAAWENNMRVWGAKHAISIAAALPTAGADPATALTYYDAARVFAQIAQYTGDNTFNTARANAAVLYRKYLEVNAYKAPGYWIFPHGLLIDYQRGVTASKGALVLLSKNAMFTYDTTPLMWTEDAAGADGGARENAYVIQAYIAAEKVGEPRRVNLKARVDQALRHMDQFAGAKPIAYVRPFMMALTAEALIDAAAHDATLVTPDLVKAKIKAAAQYAYAHCWRADVKAYTYTDRDTGSPEDLAPAPDLNLLIAPVLAYVDDPLAHEVFEGGVAGAYLGNAKQFNQNYRSSFNYVAWAKASPAKKWVCEKCSLQ